MVDVLRVILLALKDALGRPPTAAGLLDKYARLCLVVDEVINEVKQGHMCAANTSPPLDEFMLLQLLWWKFVSFAWIARGNQISS